MKKSLLFYIILFVLILSSAKVMAANATLSGLTINVGTLSPAFVSTTLGYTATVSDVTANIKVTPTQTTGGSTIKVNGTTVFSGSQSGNIALTAGTNVITIVVTKAGLTTQTYTITVTKEDINYTGTPYTIYAGSPISTISATLTGDTPTSFSISPGLPAGLTFNTITGDITGTPTVTTGAITYTVTSNYSGGVTATATLSIKISSPTISYAGSPFTLYTGSAMTPLTPTTVGGTPTSYTGSLPGGLSLDPVTGIISGTPTSTSGSNNFTITAHYGGGVTTNANINITVLAPSISYTGSPFTYYNGTAITTLSSTEVGGNPTSYSAALPAGLSINTSTGDITGTPTAVSSATAYTITATYSGGVTATTSINITVLAPTISYTGSPFTYTTGIAITSLTPIKTGSPSSYSISTTLPAGLAFSTTTGVISGTATATSSATVYTITANYSGGVTVTTAINITVNPPKPVISYAGTPFTYYQGTAISLSPNNTGGTATTWSIGPALSTGLSFDTSTGIISGTPTTLSGPITYTISATNAGGTGTTTISIKVLAPTISYSGSPFSYFTGSTITTLNSTEVGGNPTSYSGVLPTGLTLNTSTGSISGAPTIVSASTNYTITATYSAGVTATTTINIKVTASTINYAGSPFTYNAGTTITTASSTEVGGNPISYSAATLPVGLSINTSTGDITGTPTTPSAATNYTITATYTGGVTATATVNIKVQTPTISYAGSPFNFTSGVAITAANSTEVNGNPTTYSGALPAGLTLNTSTGTITGTPTTIATATNYTITATYGAGVTATTTINITVNPPAPIISYSGSPFTYYFGVPMSLTPGNTGGAAVSYSINIALPPGLSFNTVTGVISGTPTALSGAKNYIITATNAGGSGNTTINITIVNPSISYAGTPFTYFTGLPIATASPTKVGDIPTSYSGPLPAGLLLNTSTGDITGTPSTPSGASNYTITANYASGATATTTINIKVSASTISYAGTPFTFYAGSPITTASSTEIGGNPISYSGVLPAGLSLNSTTGDITGTPTIVAGPSNYTITANYTGGSTATTSVNIKVLAPTISYAGSPFTYTTGVAISSLTPVVTGSPTSYSIGTVLPAGLSFDTSTGIISGTPTGVTLATNYTITANYASGITATTTINITVNPPAPIITYPGAPFILHVGSPVSLTPTNTGGAAASYSIPPGPPLPAGLSFNTTTGIISGTPTGTSPAKNYTITATNAGGSGNITISITVVPAIPVISYTPSTNFYTVGTTITPLAPVSTGGAVVSYSIDNPLPAGLNFNTVTGVISGKPTVDITATTFTITATNAGGSGSTTINLTVYPLPPVISYTPSNNTYTVGSAITPLNPTNTGGPGVTWSIGPALPAGLTINTSTGVISGTPTIASAIKTYTISADNAGGIGTTTVKITITNPAAPNISYTPSTNIYTVGTAISSLTPVNTGGAATSYSIDITLPAGLSFDTTTGIISGTPTVSSPATTYTITATNAAGSASTTVNLAVNAQAPVISYSPATNIYTVGTTITSLTPTNTGGAAASYSIATPLPAGLSFDTSTGVISGTPTAVSPVTNYIITATNASGSSSFTETLSVNSTAPNIVYTPSTVTYSVGTTITPATPTNTGGAVASYTISGGTLPSGLTFSTSTGVISGSPTIVFPTTTFTIKGTNAAGNSSTTLIITVSPHAPVISYTPSTNAYPYGATITPLTPTNTGGAVTGYSYSSTGTALTGATLSGPSLMTIDASGNIYVANYNNGTISKWNSAHVYQGKYTTGKTMTNPEGIVFDSAGNSYVEDTGTGDVYKFNAAGAYVSTIITGLNHPLGISIDPSDNLYIATYVYTSPYTSSVTKYSTSGTLLQTLSNAQMNEADGVTVDPSGNIFVLNRGNNLTGTNMGNVTEYNSAGTYIGVFSSGYNDPLAISTDPSGDVFVADSHNNQVKIYSPSGVLLNTINGFNDVEGFVADGSGNLYVSDFTNNTVKEFSAQGGYYINAALPPGLTFNNTSGVISGTPTSVFPATTYTITAYNITGSGSTTVTLSCYQSNDWIGVTSTDWNTGSNWLNGTVPTIAQPALIGVNRTFNFFPNVLAASGTTSVGSITFGNLGGKAPGVVVNTGSTLNVVGAITYQSDASAGLGYTGLLSGAGTITTNSVGVISNTVLGSSYITTLASSVNNLNVATNIALTSSNSGALSFKSAFNLTGGTTQLTGQVQSTNTAGATSLFTIIPTTTATLQLLNASALSGLSTSGTNTVTFRNVGSTVQYAGAAQTVYTDAATAGMTTGVSYQNITFSGTGVKTVPSGNLYVVGNFTNTMANDASNYVNLASPIIYFNGNTQTLAGGGGNGTTFYNVNFNGTGTKTMVSGLFNVASSGVLTMLGSCSCNTLATGGFLTLNSDATGSATFAETDGPVITGNVNVQRYVTGGSGYRGYRLASSPVYATVVASNNVYSVNYLQNSMYLTGSGAGFDKVGNPTIYLYREDQTPSNTTFISGNWWGVSSLTSAPTYNVTGQTAGGTYNIPAGNGFLFFFRGNRASAPLATETTTAYTTPVAVTMTATGTLNQGQVIVSDWYTPASDFLGYTGSGAGTNAGVRGFNVVGNPYASTIDWEEFNTSSTTSGIYGNNVGTTIYELNPTTENYDSYQQGGAYTNHGRRSIVSGQGFFVQATNNANPQLIFNESAKLTIQNTGLNLFMAKKRADLATIKSAINNTHLRIQLELDTVNVDDTYIGFNSASSTKFVDNEDALYRAGSGKVSLASVSSDSARLAINKMPLPGLKPAIIPLYINARAAGLYKLNMTELQGIPQIYDIWLMDRYKNDSLDMRHNATYAFNITADTNSLGGKRFQLVLRQDPALGIHLLNFTAAKATGGAQVGWVIDNEQDYTNFTVERSTDGGTTFTDLGSVASSSLGTYGFLDKNPAIAADTYRLKIVDLNGTITYSNLATLMYANTNTISIAQNRISIYPNPAVSNITLTIDQAPNSTVVATPSISRAVASGNAVYSIKIVSASGSVVQNTTTTQQNWQASVSSLLPGTYVLQVVNTTDNSLVGKGTFVKL